MNNFQEKNEELNRMLTAGKFMEAFELFYAEQITMQENESEPRKGKAINREQCGGFVEAFPNLKLRVLQVAYGDRVSFQEVQFDYTDQAGNHVVYPEVAVRQWNEDGVVYEKFYYAQ